MRPRSSEVHHVLLEHTPQVLLREDQAVIQTLAPDTPQVSFADGIGAGCVVGRPEELDATCHSDSGEGWSKLVIVITNQELRAFPNRCHLAQLLSHPEIARRTGDAHVHNPPRRQLDDEEREHGPEEDVGDLQQVAGPDLLGLIAEKGGPRLTEWAGLT